MIQRTQNAFPTWAAAAIGLALAGCSPSYVVLLDNPEGGTGKVIVAGKQGSTILDKSHEATDIGSPAGKVYTVSDEKIAKDFGAALAASPMQPVSFLLYFESGGAQLTPESEAKLPAIFQEIAKHPAADISVIGHTDTADDADANTRLGMQRAQYVANLIAASESKPIHISVESHGEKNLLVPTPDNISEPRNRRVEVTVR